MIRSTPLIILTYAIVVILLGYMGYSNAQSLISLIIAGIFGLFIILMLGLAAYHRKDWLYYPIAAAVLALLGFFAYRFSSTKNFMPGVMSIFSFLVLILTVIKALSHREE
ncbi:MAG: hypothetical protein COT84_07395 [Chlamydiae bacterium CG10_big_fil_rev_8_21_14_0_10_35_9]|nr:MAG: hypothetical protein COT84_07395 [Chlamydiae bacterium CG10_big_fil_rev_8_21_14_0_10_35_9]